MTVKRMWSLEVGKSRGDGWVGRAEGGIQDCSKTGTGSISGLNSSAAINDASAMCVSKC